MSSVSYPNQYRNYCVFDEKLINKNRDLNDIKRSLDNPKNEEQVLVDLYTLNLMLDDGNRNVVALYPTLSKYNNSKSPNIQTYLAGIYRKTKIPDAFGPLVSMLIQNSIDPPKNCYFDPNEEIGGAILDYLA